MHLLETPYQREYARRRTGTTAVQYLADLGFLGPDLTLGHGVWLTEEDVERVAETGTMICHNASSNLRLRSGVAPLNQTIQAMVRKRALAARLLREHPLGDPDELQRSWAERAATENERSLLSLLHSSKLRRIRRLLEEFGTHCIDPKDGRETMRVEMCSRLDGMFQSADKDEIQEHLTAISGLKLGRPLTAHWDSKETFGNLKKFRTGL